MNEKGTGAGMKTLLSIVAVAAGMLGTLQAENVMIDYWNWSFRATVDRVGTSEVDLTIEIENHAGKTLKMINGKAVLHDITGNYLATATFDEDVDFKDGQHGTLHAKGGALDNRIAKINSSDVRMELRFEALAFADGTVVQNAVLGSPQISDARSSENRR